MIKQKICIIGNGLTGLTAALILGRLNLEVHLIATPEGEKRKDVRTTAISDSNYKSLIDLNEIPEPIKKLISEQYRTYECNDRSKLFNYFIEKRLRNLTDSIGDF